MSVLRDLVFIGHPPRPQNPILKAHIQLFDTMWELMGTIAPSTVPSPSHMLVSENRDPSIVP